MTDGQKFLGDWNSATLYDEGVLVLSGGNVYIAVTTHTSAAQFATDILKWEVFATGSNFRNTWSAATRYRVGDVVRYNGYTYECVLEHTSGTVTDGVIVGVGVNETPGAGELVGVIVGVTVTVGVTETDAAGVGETGTEKGIDKLFVQTPVEVTVIFVAVSSN
jgi:hypothetical protein